MNILSANTVSSSAQTGTVIGEFSHAGASDGQFILDAEAQVFFSVNAGNQLVWSPVAGISIMTGSYPITVSAIFSGYDAEACQFIIQVTT
jgi:hypothetical protein